MCCLQLNANLLAGSILAAHLLLGASICEAAASPTNTLRVTGVVQPLRSFIVQVPLIQGQGGNVTLTKLVPNGVKVGKGELLAEFDSTKEQQALRDAAAKFEDFSHQVEQKAAEHRNNAAKRQSDFEQAKADLAKAQIELRKGPILTEIDLKKDQIKVRDGQEHVESLQKSTTYHEQAEAAESRILELQRDRQKMAVERARANIEKLALRAPLDGMVALQNVYRNNSMGHAQEGDQLWPGTPLLRLFDPNEMEVNAEIQEPDVIALAPNTQAVVHLDAYPGIGFQAVFESASPVASSAMQSPIKTFGARFRLVGSDPHLLPDLSAAVDIEIPESVKDSHR
jgi:multidrug resistance efflux pump